VGATMSRASNLVVRLNAGQQPIQTVQFNGGGNQQVVSRIVPGFPIYGSWVRPILGYADGNQNGLIEPSEVLVGDSLVYVGQPQPTYQLNLHTNVALLQGRLTLSTSVAYQNGVTQFNQVGTGTSTVGNTVNVGAYGSLFGNDPSVSFGQQAAIAAFNNGFGTAYGLIQTVNTLRWQDLSLNYTAPTALAQLLRAHQLVIALQASNLGLHTNYRGKDPSVNAFSSGEGVMDTGQIPLPRTVNLKLILGN